MADRRQFLGATLAAGTVLGAAGSNADAFVSRALPRDDNPAARPGRVRWHANFAAAQAAARRSLKPVFLFHMLGRLDQRFC